MPDFATNFKPHYYSDPYYFGFIYVAECYAFPRAAIGTGYALTEVPVLDENEDKIDGWFLAQRGREFAFVRRH